MSGTAVTITTADGVTLGGHLFLAPGADTVVIVHGATAVPHRFYGRFAAALQAHGWSALTYDYRGIGASRPPSLRGFRAQASDWGLLDMPATLSWVQAQLEPRRVFLVGHSAGGQQAGLLEHADAVTAMLTVSSQSGYWRLQGGIEKLNVWALATFVLPLLSRLFGYFPWSRLGAGEDIPRDAAIQWARWCRSPGYLLDDDTLPLQRYADFVAPILAYSIDDDQWGTPAAVDAMMTAYPHVTRQHLVAADYGLASIGHMGYFRAGAETLWREAIEWLDQHAAP